MEKKINQDYKITTKELSLIIKENPCANIILKHPIQLNSHFESGALFPGDAKVTYNGSRELLGRK